MDVSFSDRSHGVMERARVEASRLCHEYIGTEHILLGIVGEATGGAASALKTFGITRDQIRSIVEDLIVIGPSSASPDDRGVSPRAKQVIDSAQVEAVQRLNPTVEAEHLLLGITREVNGVGAQVLRNLEVSLQAVAAEVSKLLG